MGSHFIGLILAAESPWFWESNDWILKIISWFALSIFLLFVVFPLLGFLSALLEKQHVRPYVLASKEDRRKRKVPQAVETAMVLDYRPLGLFANCDSGKKTKPVFLLLSNDGEVLMRVWPGGRYQAMTRLQSGHWIVTADQFPTRDLSGLNWEEGIPDAPLSMALDRHRQRIGQAAQPSVPFTIEGAAADLFGHERQRVARLKELGLARWVGSGEETWSYTVRGAIKMAVQVAHLMRTIREEKKRVEELKKVTELPLKVRPTDVAVRGS